MNQQHTRTLQEMRTSLPGDRVLAAAKDFFANRPSLYSAFIEQESDTHVSMRGQGGEEIVIGVRPVPEGTAVTGSSYLFDMQVQRFFASLPPAPEAPAVPEPAMEDAAAAGGAAVA
jgi:hypothetical protein